MATEHHPTPTHLVLASAAAGLIARITTHPLDTLRANLMVAQRTPVRGIANWYRGLPIALVFQAPAQVTYFVTYEYTKRYLASLRGGPETAQDHFLGGFVAESLSCLFWVPMETIKQKQQITPISNSSPILIARDLVKVEGLRGLFRGYGVTLAVFGPYSAVYFMMYERLKKVGPQQEVITPVKTLVCASAAAAVASASTSPIDVLKTRLQTREIGSYATTWTVLKSLLQTEGPSALWRGLLARVAWVTPGTAITMICYESLKSLKYDA